MTDRETFPVWPGWETVRRIGNGSFGAVYEIRREVFGHEEKAALKLIRIPQDESELDELRSDGYDEPSLAARFKGYLQDIVREYSLMADMKGCSNVVYCDDLRTVQHDNGIGWDILIKMELLTALPNALEKAMTETGVIQIGKDICSALIICEKRKLIHRDIKPQNIFVAPDGTIKLGDFGIAKTAERTASGTKTGTFKYMAPEVYNNQPYGGKADIYSLGLVLYWLLNERRTPFLPKPPVMPSAREEEEARNRRFRGEPIPAPAHGSPELQRIVLKACAFAPEDRYRSAEEMLRDLEAAERGILHGGSEEDRGTVPPAGFGGPDDLTLALDENGLSKTTALTDRIGTDRLSPETADQTVPLETADGSSDTAVLAGTVPLAGRYGDAYRAGNTPGDPAAPRAEEPKKKGFNRKLLFFGCALLAVLVLIILLSKGGSEDPKPTEQPPTQETAGPAAGGETNNAHVHDWAPATCTEPETCRSCRATRGTALGHTWTPATCTEPATCRSCGATSGTALGHDWAAATCTKPATCKVCGATNGTALGHDWAAATCTKPATCRVCGETSGTALGHDWAAATYTKPETCRRCGEERGQPLPRPVNTSGYTYESIWAGARKAAANTNLRWNYTTTSRGDSAPEGYRDLQVPSDSELLQNPFKMQADASNNRVAIYILPLPETGHGYLGRVADGETVTVLSTVYKNGTTYYFFVTDDGRAGWNGSSFFR